MFNNESIITNYTPNTQNIHSQHNILVRTFSSFQQNSSAHRKFQKDFLDNDFGHVCDICDRLWFKKDLKIFVNNDTTSNIQFIRTMLKDVNLIEVKVQFICLWKRCWTTRWSNRQFRSWPNEHWQRQNSYAKLIAH